MTTDLAVIEAALDAATAAETWWVHTHATSDNRTVLTVFASTEDTPGVVVPVAVAECERRLPDAHLIANAPAWLAELLERVKVAEAQVETLRAAVEWSDDCAEVRADVLREEWALSRKRATTAEATIARVRELAESAAPKTIARNPSDAAYLSGQVDFAESVLDALNHTGGTTPESGTSDEEQNA